MDLVAFGPQGVGRLPSEIWRRILALLDLRVRLCATHVCHGLRQHVLETVTFWRVLDLNLVPDSRAPDAQGRWGELVHSSHSCREGLVRWMAAPPHWPAMGAHPLRHVHTLCLPRLVFDDVTVDFPSLIDRRTAPALTDLDLCGVSGRFAEQMVGDLLRNCSQTLKTVLLCDIPGSVLGAPGDLMSMICNDSQGMPRLEVLDLSGSFCYPGHDLGPGQGADFCDMITSFCPRLHSISVGYQSELQTRSGWPAACIMASDDLIDSPAAGGEPEESLFERLQELRIHGAPRLSDAGFLFGAHLKRETESGWVISSDRNPLPLRTLVIPYALQVTASGLGPLLPHCPLLTTLNIRCSGAGGVLSAVAACCPRLTSLNVSCTTIEPVSVRELAHGCPALQVLDLCYATCASEADDNHKRGFDVALREAVHHVCHVHGASGSVPLRMLGLGGFRALRDEHMRAILALCPALDHLGIGGCLALSPTALDVVGELSPQLTSLNAHELQVAGPHVIERLLERCPALHSIDFEGVAGSSTTGSNDELHELLGKLAESRPYRTIEDRLSLTSP